MRELLEGAELVRYGAKAIPVGGLYAQPKLYTDGALLVGDSAGICNAQKLAGVHMAMKIGDARGGDAGRCARAQDFSAGRSAATRALPRRSWA